MTEGCTRLRGRAGNHIAVRCGEPQLFAAHRLDHHGQRQAAHKRLRALPRGAYKALRHRHAQRRGQFRHPLLAVEQIELVGRGDAQTTDRIKPRAVCCEGGKRGRTHGQQGGLASLLLPHAAAQIIQRIQIPLRGQPHMAGRPARQRAQRRGRAIIPTGFFFTGDDLHAGLSQIADQGKRHAVMNVGNDGEHGRPPSQNLWLSIPLFARLYKGRARAARPDAPHGTGPPAAASHSVHPVCSGARQCAQMLNCGVIPPFFGKILPPTLTRFTQCAKINK